ncbi:hypothetical protein [Pseudomonas sp. CFBP 8772]|uniref:hypothetical protein n=1 Tax=Pseudomonas sp. CFBP 8772 TaxID=2775284 RepID=UPI0017845298|nr:hypothetical protein [Pseudomonas sp. CFBP 8772]MBD8599174.1 hypothetical protein [Pseudomonas sp. CFBP 8772]
MITGWIERNEGSIFFGWFSCSDELLVKHKALHIYFSGELRWIKKIIIKPADRPDLATYANAFLFEFDLSTEDFHQGASTCSINFKLSCSDVSYPLLVTPHLVSQSVAVADSLKEGLSFGRISSDGAAIIGAGGKIFLREGTNNVEGLYNGETFIDSRGWLQIFQSRHARSISSGYDYIQIIIPEKSSVMYWNAPFHATKGSQGLQSIVDGVQNLPDIRRSLIYSADYIPDEVHAESTFRAFDTHMSTYGSKLLIDALLDRLAPQSYSVYRLGPVMHGDAPGDLGIRFSEDGYIVERPPLYESLLDQNGDILTPEAIDEFDPSEGNIGLRRIWRCSNAPIQKRVICFGGSSFERGEVSTTLSWWCSRLFAEFHFYWGPDCLSEIVDSLSPDIVICQTIERFLTVVPRQ